MKKVISAFIILSALIFPLVTLAQDYGFDGTEVVTSDIRAIIGSFINIALSFLGILAVIIIMWGGFLWMIAGSDLEKVDKAKRTLFSGIIGLIIIMSSYVIAYFVISTMQRILGNTAPTL